MTRPAATDSAAQSSLKLGRQLIVIPTYNEAENLSALPRVPAHDTTSGFKGWRAPLLREVLSGRIDTNGYVLQIEMTHRAVQARARITEVPIQFVDRQLGTSKFSSGSSPRRWLGSR